MKKLIFTALVLLCAFLPSGCAQKSGKEQLFIYNWTYYIPDDVLRDFEKEYNVSIVYDMYASNEEMFTKLKAGGTGYDLVFPSGDYVSIMAHEGMLAPLDKNKLPNFAHLDPTILAKINFDKGNQYSVPYILAASGIAVNKSKVKEYEPSWRLFERPDLKGRMTMLDDMREVMGAALKTLGYSVNSAKPAELQAAKQLVLKWKANLQKFDAESFSKAFAAGEFFVVHGYAENIFLEYDKARRAEVDFFIPKEGGPMYMDSMVILKDAKHKELAHTFANYIHRPEIYARIVDFLMLPSINVPARTLTKVKPNYAIDELHRCEFKEDLGPSLEAFNQVWQEIRIGN